jgi:hypothetical protein
VEGTVKLRDLIVFAVFLSLAVPAIAAARPAEPKHSNLFQLDVILPTSNGYSMEIDAEDHRHVELTASKGKVAVHYSVLGRASSRQIDADFGALGEVHVRLRLKPELVVPGLFGDKRCGERFGIYGGSFRGKVDFTGEPQVAGVVAHHGPVSFLRSKRTCKDAHRRPVGSLSRSVEGKAHPAEEADLLLAELKEEGRTVSFEAVRFRGNPRKPRSTMTFLSADVSESLGRVTIDRTAFETTRAKVLRISKQGKQPETVVAEPAKPFAGSASYSASPETPASWSGDLSVRLPGAGTVPLTGTGFRAELCRGLSPSESDDCAEPPAFVVVP